MKAPLNRRHFIVGIAALPLAISTSAAQPRVSPTRRIFAGGGGLTASNNLLLMEYLIGLTGKENPVICFLPTAQGDNSTAIMFWYELMNRLPCRPRHLRVFGSSRLMAEFGPQLLAADAIFVGPGSTLNMLALWEAQGVGTILRTAWERGVILAGESAGLNCWFEQSVTDSRPERLTAMPGLGFLPGSVCPHYDSERERRPSYHRMIQSGEIKEGIGCEDWVALLYEGTTMTRAVASRPEKIAYHVRLIDGSIREEPIPTELLVAPPNRT